MIVQRSGRGNEFYCSLSILFPSVPRVIGVTKEHSSMEDTVVDGPKEDGVSFESFIHSVPLCSWGDYC